MNNVARKLAVVLACAGVAGGLAVVITSATDSGTGRAAAGAPRVAAGTASTPPAPETAALGQTFGLLRRSPTAADAVPAKFLNLLADGPTGTPDLSAARRVPDRVAGAMYWVAPAGGSVCILGESGAATSFACHTAAEVLAGDAISTSSGVGFGLSEDQVRVFGLLPDDAKTSRVVLRDGTSQPFVATNNLYSVTVTGTPDRVEWTDSSGSGHSTHVPIG
jgi:hypothetical protein